MKNVTKEIRNRVVQVALPLPARRTFDYQLRREHRAVREGSRVRVPLQQREMTGMVIGSETISRVPRRKLKSVSAVLDTEPSIPSGLLKFLKWAADYYHHPIGEVIRAALPTAMRNTRSMQPRLPTRYSLTSTGRAALRSLSKQAIAQRRVLGALEEAGDGGLPLDALTHLVARPASTLKLLRDHGWIEMYQNAEDFLLTAAKKAGPALNQSQMRAVRGIGAALSRYVPFLLQGVTGSGKTEIYLKAAASVVANGRQALVLVPEIALTPQLLARFQEGLGGTVAAIHSGLTDRERHIAWWAARQGLADVVVGTRSAVFTPLARPGLYIVDEEHDASYKQQDGFRYHARDLIVKRAHQDGVPVILGSATPSLESMENVRRGRYRQLLLKQRAGGAAMPKFQLLDLGRLPVTSGMTPPVLAALRLRLDRGEQSIVYVNRRGFAPVVLCSTCRWQAQCDRCDVHLTLHRRSERLRCHHCGASRDSPEQCPNCGQSTLHPVGEGTQRIEETLQKALPGVRILRLDSDNVGNAAGLAADLARVRQGTIDVLVGTQLVAKGHDFPAVTLVCILNADSGLYSVDFRAAERLYQQLTQVAGRAGRADRPGQVLVQTRYPENVSFSRLVRHDFSGFVTAELDQRRLARCPPFVRFALLRAESLRPAAPLEFISLAARVGHRRLAGQASQAVRLMDPVPSPMERRAGRYRAQLLVTSRAHTLLHRFLDDWLCDLGGLKRARSVRWSLDVDPIEMY
ncbi:MAG: primosomal protein N' [Pedosphaera sp.]|nr:primosomal protein N' [Pedosphaera sp.]